MQRTQQKLWIFALLFSLSHAPVAHPFFLSNVLRNFKAYPFTLATAGVGLALTLWLSKKHLKLKSAPKITQTHDVYPPSEAYDALSEGIQVLEEELKKLSIAAINKPNPAKHNKTLLEWAIYNKSAQEADAILLLIQYGANPNQQDQFGTYVIFHAIQLGYPEAVQLLKNSGCDLSVKSNLPNWYDLTPYQMVQKGIDQLSGRQVVNFRIGEIERILTQNDQENQEKVVHHGRTFVKQRARQ